MKSHTGLWENCLTGICGELMINSESVPCIVIDSSLCLELGTRLWGLHLEVKHGCSLEASYPLLNVVDD